MTSTGTSYLTRLLAKAATGTASQGDFYEGLGADGSAVRAFHAFNGSLDAAKVLHDDVLPDWGMEMAINDGYCSVLIFPDNQRSEYGDDDWITNKVPARAWLLTILDAMITKEFDNAEL